MKYFKIKKYILMLAFLITLLCTPVGNYFSFSDTAYASYGSFLDKSEGSTYSKTYGQVEGSTAQTVSGDNEVESDKVGFIEESISKLFYNLGRGVGGQLKKIGLTLDTIIMGRVGGYDTLVSGGADNVTIANTSRFFHFELVENNPYGLIGSKIYTIIRGMVWAFVGIIFVFVTAKHGIKEGTDKSYCEYKEFVASLFIFFILLAAMPNLYDLGLYARDVILLKIKSAFISDPGMDIISVIGSIYNAPGGSTLVNGIMYAGANGVVIYYVFVYASLALTNMILFFLFPCICIMSIKDKSRLQNWVTMVFSNLATPVIDLVVMLVPIYIGSCTFGVEDSDATLLRGLLQLILVACVIPTRGAIRSFLGVGAGMKSELLGFGAMMGAMGLARNVLGKGKGAFSNAKDMLSRTREDRSMRKQHEALAKAEKESGTEDGTSAAIRLNYSGTISKSSVKSSLSSSSGGNSNLSGTGINKNSKATQDVNVEAGHKEGLKNKSLDSRMKNMQDMDQTNVNIDAMKEKRDGLSEENNALRTKKTEKQDHIAEAQLNTARKNSAIETSIKQSRKELANNPAPERREALQKSIADDELSISKNNEALFKQKAEMQSEIGEIDNTIGNNNESLSSLNTDINQSQKDLDVYKQREQALSGGRSRVGSAEELSSQRQQDQIIASFANVKNFESDRFKGILSHEQMANFYKKKARQDVVSTVGGGALRTAATVAGGSAGAALSIYGGGKAVTMGATLGAAAGSYAGNSFLEATDIVSNSRVGNLAGGIISHATADTVDAFNNVVSSSNQSNSARNATANFVVRTGTTVKSGATNIGNAVTSYAGVNTNNYVPREAVRQPIEPDLTKYIPKQIDATTKRLFGSNVDFNNMNTAQQQQVVDALNNMNH